MIMSAGSSIRRCPWPSPVGLALSQSESRPEHLFYSVTNWPYRGPNYTSPFQAQDDSQRDEPDEGRRDSGKAPLLAPL